MGNGVETSPQLSTNKQLLLLLFYLPNSEIPYVYLMCIIIQWYYYVCVLLIIIIIVYYYYYW